MISVHITGHLKDYTGKARDVKISGDCDSILNLVRRLDELFPGIRDRILDEQDRPRQFVNIFVNGENIRDGGQLENTRLKDGDSVHILPSVAGG